MAIDSLAIWSFLGFLNFFPLGVEISTIIILCGLCWSFAPQRGQYRRDAGHPPSLWEPAFALCLPEVSPVPFLPCPKAHSVSTRDDGVFMKQAVHWEMCCGQWCSECSCISKGTNMCTWSCLGLTRVLRGESKTIIVINNGPAGCAGKLGVAGLAKGCLLVFSTQLLGEKSEGEERGGGGGSSPIFAVGCCHSFGMWRLSWCYLLQLRKLYKQRGWN